MIRPECYLRAEEGWQPPTGDEIKMLLNKHNITNYRAHKLLNVSAMKPGRWLSGEAVISYAEWMTLLAESRMT